MIFPILSGLVSFKKAPITWIIIAINVMMSVFATRLTPPDLEALMSDGYFVRTQGRLYAQYLQEKASPLSSELLIEMSRQVLAGEADSKSLGELAFRDTGFLQAADTLDHAGDQVAFKLWKKRLATLEDLEERHPSFTMGLSARDMSLDRWVSYIFVHSGFIHLFGNMLILLIFGAALEAQIGGLAMLTMFLLTGVFSAGVFALLTGVANSPLVGASGSISGVMALYCVLNWKKPARYFYWFFLPFRGYMGLVYLPAYVGLIFWAASDLAGYLGTPNELGGIAFTAHLGGEMAGAIAALVLVGLRRFRPVQMVDSVPPGVPMGKLIPFLPPLPNKAA